MMGASDRSGVLLVDKPAGPTSHDVVVRARRALGTRRIGHTGTLDPFASGLLALCVGAATRIASLLSALPKRYEAEMTLGTSTTTDDPTGETVATTDDWKRLEVGRITESLLGQIGPLDQRPPAFSAKKVQGERMYRLARAGRAPPVEPVRVVVHALEITAIRLPVVHFLIVCSAGTYVRAIARDAGDRLGVPAHLSALRRTRIGDLDVADAVALEEISDPVAVQPAWRAPLDVLHHLPHFDVDGRGADDLRNGRATRCQRCDPPCDVGIAAHEARLVAIVRCDDGWLRPRKVFA